jgi:peptidoglycan/xylan/chitin deacetylase (PgdA/CDA1 family)
MDHDHYAWSALPTRPPLRWPDGAQLALCVVVLLEQYDFQPPPDSYTLRRPSGGFFPLPFPDYVRLGHRDYGHRVGIYRVLDALERAGVPATVAVDALTAEHYPFLMRHLGERGVEVMGHGVAASRLITSRMGEADERATIAEGLGAVEAVTGRRPTGWLSPEGAESTRTPLLLAEAGVGYLCDWPNDEQPYAMTVPGGELISLPGLLEIDDEFALWHRKLGVERWARMAVEAAEVLHADGAASGRLLLWTVRPWLVGQPFRIGAFEAALRTITSWPAVWAAHGDAIASHFRATVGSG